MAKTNLNTEPSMAAFVRGLPAGLVNLHSSHPAPLSRQQLADIVSLDSDCFMQALSEDYVPVSGSHDLRQAIVSAHYTDMQAEAILTTCGAQEGLFICMQALLKKGDHVVCLSPLFEPLYLHAKMTGAKVDTVPLKADKNWKIDWSALKNAVTDQTRLLVINFPHNPTGAHISDSELNDLVALCRQHECWLLSDEVFRGLEHQSKHRLPAAVDCYDRAISVGVFSKAYGLPSIRLGWIACRQAHMRDRMITVKLHLSICGSRLDEVAAKQLLPHSQAIFDFHRKQLALNRHALADFLSKHGQFQAIQPVAGATCFIRPAQDDNSQKPEQQSAAFARDLAITHGVLVLPGSCFMSDVPGFRLSIGDKSMVNHYPKLSE